MKRPLLLTALTAALWSKALPAGMIYLAWLLACTF